MFLDPQIDNHILHPALTQKIGIINNRGVVRYVEHPYMIYSFQLMSISRHKCHWKKVAITMCSAPTWLLRNTIAKSGPSDPYVFLAQLCFFVYLAI